MIPNGVSAERPVDNLSLTPHTAFVTTKKAPKRKVDKDDEGVGSALRAVEHAIGGRLLPVTDQPISEHARKTRPRGPQAGSGKGRE